MRSSKSRSRSKPNRNRSVGNIVNRVFDSSGPEGKVRGTPQQIIDKYNQLARDAQLSNDRVAAENFQQHAEHYLRLLSEAMREQQERQQQQQAQADARREEDNRNGGQQNRNNQDRNQQDRNQQDHGQQNRGQQDRNQQPDRGQQSADNDQPRSGGNDQQPQRDTQSKDARRSDDVIDISSEAESGLVETPEEKPAKPRRARKKSEPKPEVVAAGDDAPTDAVQPDVPTPDAAE